MAESEKATAALVPKDALILITGAQGFIGSRVLAEILSSGFTNIRCFSRSPSAAAKLEKLVKDAPSAQVEFVTGNLLWRKDCEKAAAGVSVVYHLAAGRGEKSVPDAFMNSVVTTRNLLDAFVNSTTLKRFVSISSFAVYQNRSINGRGVLDETSLTEVQPSLRGDAYTFAKVKQDEIVEEYRKKFGIPAVIVRPGVVYGPGNPAITGRVGIGSFGVFLHLGGSNPIPFTYVDNCASAIVLAGIQPGIDGEVFNVVDDDVPRSRTFLGLYKKNVRSFRSIYLPKVASYLFCFLWEKYSSWSNGQLPPVYNRRAWRAFWKKTTYSNAKMKAQLGWKQKVPTSVGLQRYFDSVSR
jgi:nucleoside-diphosphate-sugar epimerase